MTEEETSAYLEQMNMKILTISNSVDYYNIENPIQTYQQQRIFFRLRKGTSSNKRIDFTKHTFTDNTWLFQILGGEQQTTFLNQMDIIDRSASYNFDEIKYYAQITFFLGETHIIQHRKIYDTI